MLLRSATILSVVLVGAALPAALPANTYLVPGYSESPAPAHAEGALRELLGRSGNLRAVFGSAATLLQVPALGTVLAGIPLGPAGARPFELSAPGGAQLAVLLLQPFEAGPRGQIGPYRVGRWRVGAGAMRGPEYTPPREFIPVTPENRETPVSKRFVLGDFVTHDQADVWPKVLVLRMALLDKLELIGSELERRGLPGRLQVMSGFRTPQYNALGVGRRGGRARDSRHMYGDAADVIVDANQDGRMDDLDGDGRVTVRDARVLYAVAETIEARHPELVGGLATYTATAAHGPFVHVDARGTRARW